MSLRSILKVANYYSVKYAVGQKIYQCLFGAGICKLHGVPTKQTICPECTKPTKEIINPTPAQLQFANKPVVEQKVKKVYKCTNTGSFLECPSAGFPTKYSKCKSCSAPTVEIKNPTLQQIQSAYSGSVSNVSKSVFNGTQYHPIQNQIKSLITQINSAISANHPNKNEIAKLQNAAYRLANDAWQSKKPLFEIKAQYNSLKMKFDTAIA